MKLLFISDTHWNLLNVKDDINFSEIDLIVLLWDNTIEDLEILQKIDKPKIWVLGNNKFRGEDKKVWILEKYWVRDISFQKFEFMWINFYWIDWQVGYQLVESLLSKNNSFKIFNPNISVEIEKFEKKKLDLFSKKNIDILISHFPAQWIMDSNSFSHKWLEITRKFLENNKPKYFFHWHLHNEQEEYLWNTKIIQVFPYKIIEI